MLLNIILGTLYSNCDTIHLKKVSFFFDDGYLYYLNLKSEILKTLIAKISTQKRSSKIRGEPENTMKNKKMYSGPSQKIEILRLFKVNLTLVSNIENQFADLSGLKVSLK